MRIRDSVPAMEVHVLNISDGHRTRPPFDPPARFEAGRNYLQNPNGKRAYDFTWWSRGVGKTMRRGYDQWRKSQWYPEHKLRYERRAHAQWRRGHRVRRAQWHTQTFTIRFGGAWFYMPAVKYYLMGWHWLMQKAHERAFAKVEKARRALA